MCVPSIPTRNTTGTRTKSCMLVHITKTAETEYLPVRQGGIVGPLANYNLAPTSLFKERRVSSREL